MTGFRTSDSGFACRIFAGSGRIAALVVTAVLLWAGCGVLGGGGDSTPPDVPSNVTATSGSETVELEWSASGTDDVNGYNVYRETGDSVTVDGATPVNGDSLISSPSFTDQGVENGTTYGFRVTAVDDNGNESEGSSTVQATPFADPPSRPAE